MPTIAQLNQRHPSLDLEHHADLCALYEGDKKFFARLGRFLHQREREPAARYETRKREAHYRNYVGPAIDYFTAMLFSSRPATVATSDGEEVVEPGEYYDKLRDDCDRNGANLDAMFKGRLTDAMVAGRSWLRIHAPQEGEQAPVNLAEFEKRKLGDCWLEALEYVRVLDWETTDSGGLAWAIVHRCEARRATLNADRNTVRDVWEYITPTDVSTYALTYERSKPPGPTEEVPLIEQVAHKFGRVPLVCLDLPHGLWVANRLRSPQLAHFRASNAQTWSLSVTCYAMTVAKVADPEEFAKAVHGAGYGIVIGKDEDWGWEAPPSGHFAALDTEIKSQKDEIFRIVQQMAIGVDNNAAAVGRSGESKQADIEATRVVLLAYSRAVKEAIEYTYDLISAVRGDKFEWSVQGLDDFAALDVGGLAETLAQIKDIGGIPSKTWNVAIKTRLAEALLPDLDQETKAKVRKEIEDGEPEPGDELAAEVERLHALSAGLTGSDGEDGSGNPKTGGGKPPPFARRGNGRPGAAPPTT